MLPSAAWYWEKCFRGCEGGHAAAVLPGTVVQVARAESLGEPVGGYRDPGDANSEWIIACERGLVVCQGDLMIARIEYSHARAITLQPAGEKSADGLVIHMTTGELFCLRVAGVSKGRFRDVFNMHRFLMYVARGGGEQSTLEAT